MNDWQPIETYPLPPFNESAWFMSGPSVLLWNGAWPVIGAYSYTQKGKGRWRDWRGTVNPTHWMPLPSPPVATVPTPVVRQRKGLASLGLPVYTGPYDPESDSIAEPQEAARNE